MMGMQEALMALSSSPKSLIVRAGNKFNGYVCIYNCRQNISAKLQFSYEIAHYGKSSISIFQKCRTRPITYTILLLIIMLRFTSGERKLGKTSEYYDHGCLQNFLLHFMSLLTVPILKNSHILTGIYIILLKEHTRPNRKVLQNQI